MRQLGRGRRLELAGPTPMVEKVFRRTRMYTIFNLYGSLKEAISETKVGT